MDSPCIKVCVIDVHTSLCGGCHRSLSEIAKWTQLTAADRQRITASLPTRALSTFRIPGADKTGKT
jgi:uncharacterized protein